MVTIANQFGTPTYVYSKNTLIQTFESFKKGLLKTDHLICFAVKANSNIAILNLFASLGAGFEQTAEAFKDLAVGQTKRIEEIGISAQQANGKIQLSFKGVNIEVEKK